MADLVDVVEELDKLANNLDNLNQLHERRAALADADQNFANDLVKNYLEKGCLTDRQWYWVGELLNRLQGAEPLYGDYKAIRVMFMLAGEHLKRPRVRLVAASGRFVELQFDVPKGTVKVYVDGWQGSGYKKFAGTVEDNCIKPYRSDRMTDEVRNLLQELALDPMGVAKASANKLGCCVYCAQRLSDTESKRRGYGPICAGHYGLPWGAGK